MVLNEVRTDSCLNAETALVIILENPSAFLIMLAPAPPTGYGMRRTFCRFQIKESDDYAATPQSQTGQFLAGDNLLQTGRGAVA
jgi:hypothetical protein